MIRRIPFNRKNLFVRVKTRSSCMPHLFLFDARVLRADGFILTLCTAFQKQQTMIFCLHLYIKKTLINNICVL